MATKSKKKSKKSPEKKPAKSDVTPFRAEKEDKIDLKAIARDERTWKIVGAFSLLLSVFLFISFSLTSLPGSKIRLLHNKALAPC
jgi:S-DNA-T family DNA segregation ATPase FtsK/SpoIIIE